MIVVETGPAMHLGQGRSFNGTDDVRFTPRTKGKLLQTAQALFFLPLPSAPLL